MQTFRKALCLVIVLSLCLPIFLWDVESPHETRRVDLYTLFTQTQAMSSVAIPPLHGSGKKLIDRFHDLDDVCHGGWTEPARTSVYFTHHQCRSVSFGGEYDGVLATSVDANAIPLLVGLLSSFSQHNHGAFRVLVLGLDLGQQLLSELCAYLTRVFSNLTVEFFTMDSKATSTIFNYKSILKHVPIVTMTRLLLPLLAPATVSKLIYLDLDTIVAGDLRPLWSGQLCTSHDLCAKMSLKNTTPWLPPTVQCYLQAFNDFKAFNAGVMHMDLRHMRDWGLPSFAIYMARMFQLNDQSILNLYAAFETSLGELDAAYNIFYKQDDSKFQVDSARILHSAGSSKVWKTNSPWAALWKDHLTPNLLFVWSSLTTEIPEHVILALSSAANNTAGLPVFCFCTIQRCQRQVQTLALPNVHVVRLGLNDLVNMDSPLSPWFSKSSLIKIWTGAAFPEFLRVAIELQILYHHGGLLSDWDLRLVAPFQTWRFDTPWCQDIGVKGSKVFHSPPRSSMVSLLMQDFLRIFDEFDPSLGESLQVPERWAKGCYRPSLDGLSNAGIESSYEPLLAPAFQPVLPQTSHFGQMWLDLRSNYLRSRGNMGVNLGDEVQGLASVQWLPYIDRRVERDGLNASTGGSGPTLTFLNAWYGTRTMGWPPSNDIDPIVISMHVEPGVRELFSSNASVAYLRAQQPIGARDTSTLEFLEHLGVDAYLSYCMTLTFQNMTHVPKNRACRILIVDVDPTFTAMLPKELSPYICSASPKWLDVNGTGATLNGLARYTKAYSLLESYASAGLVITSRLHTALPCASFGIPVVLLLNKHMPGGGGANDDHGRFSGFQELVHTFNLRDGGDTSAFVDTFPWLDPAPNPGHAELVRIRCQIFDRIIKSHPVMHDWIQFFGGQVLSEC